MSPLGPHDSVVCGDRRSVAAALSSGIEGPLMRGVPSPSVAFPRAGERAQLLPWVGTCEAAVWRWGNRPWLTPTRTLGSHSIPDWLTLAAGRFSFPCVSIARALHGQPLKFEGARYTSQGHRRYLLTAPGPPLSMPHFFSRLRTLPNLSIFRIQLLSQTKWGVQRQADL